jgi:hypothetical protein
VRLGLTIIPEKYTECVPGKKEAILKAVARPVEKEVTRCRTVPVCVTDPCTGQICTVYNTKRSGGSDQLRACQNRVF